MCQGSYLPHSISCSPLTEFTLSARLDKIFVQKFKLNSISCKAYELNLFNSFSLKNVNHGPTVSELSG